MREWTTGSPPPRWSRRLAEVRWGVAGRMVIAWLVTLPAAALIGGVVLASRRDPVDAHDVDV